MTVIQLILHYITTSLTVIASHDIELTIPILAKNDFGVQHNPATYSRKFRNIRQRAGIYGLSFETLSNGKEKAWKVTVNDSLKLQQALSQTGVAV